MLESRWRLEEGFRIELFSEQDEVGAQDVVDLWVREGVVAPDEADRRIHEVLFVAFDPADQLIGVSSAYLQYTPRLVTNLWFYRAFVSKAHQKSRVAVTLALMGRDHLRDRFASGEDSRAPGAIFEVENPGLKRRFNQAVWYPTDFLYIGENERGDHVRVHWFPGALAPEPPRS